MAESAALLVDEVLPEQPIRQWVLSFPFQLRFLFASRPELMAGDRVQGHLGPADPKSRIHSKDRANRRGDADPAIWQRVEPEYTFPHAFSGWHLHRKQIR